MSGQGDEMKSWSGAPVTASAYLCTEWDIISDNNCKLKVVTRSGEGGEKR